MADGYQRQRPDGNEDVNSLASCKYTCTAVLADALAAARMHCAGERASGRAAGRCAVVGVSGLVRLTCTSRRDVGQGRGKACMRAVR